MKLSAHSSAEWKQCDGAPSRHEVRLHIDLSILEVQANAVHGELMSFFNDTALPDLIPQTAPSADLRTRSSVQIDGDWHNDENGFQTHMDVSIELNTDRDVATITAFHHARHAISQAIADHVANCLGNVATLSATPLLPADDFAR
ncbi:hypothetical protein [Pseudidiomarina sp.]|uniref:hypothetical protein n=1 Tax=Pseudidiomarina sp. TaxID=2081707 RepID=UPI003A97E9F9